MKREPQDLNAEPSADRRRHDPEFKRRVVEASMADGASIAQVALANGINANLLHTWRWQHRQRAAQAPRGFVAVQVADPASVSPAALTSGRIEIHLGQARVIVVGTPPLASLRMVMQALQA